MKTAHSYQWVLFDADNTLFHFNDFHGLRTLMAERGVSFTRQDFRVYQQTNRALWKAYEKGDASPERIASERFELWAKRLNTNPEELNCAFLSTMARVCTPLPGALSLLNQLQGHIKMGIITNGFSQMQADRLLQHGLTDHFEFVLTSQEAGVAKPHKGIFEHAMQIMGQANPTEVLMVGDNPHSDIQGGINAGMATCWLNTRHAPLPTGIAPNWQIPSLSHLLDIINIKK